LKLLSSSQPRAIVRRSLRYVTVQIAGYDVTGDKIIASAVSRELKKFGWTKSTSTTPAAYLSGFLTAKRALKKGTDSAVLDIGLRTPAKGAKTFAALKGLTDGGLSIPHDPQMFPSDERIKGAHLGDDVVKMFEAVKSKLEGLK
jgi:large subunit ribosomal protein L18